MRGNRHSQDASANEPADEPKVHTFSDACKKREVEMGLSSSSFSLLIHFDLQRGCLLKWFSDSFFFLFWAKKFINCRQENKVMLKNESEINDGTT